MSPQPKGIIPPEDLARLRRTKRRSESAHDAYVQAVVAALTGGGSFSEVSRETGLSTNTLQRWLRDSREST